MSHHVCICMLSVRSLHTPMSVLHIWYRSHTSMPLLLCCRTACRTAGAQVKLFQSVIPVFRFDIPTSLFLMPYLVHNVLAHGSDLARQGVQQEIQVGGVVVVCKWVRGQEWVGGWVVGWVGGWVGGRTHTEAGRQAGRAGLLLLVCRAHSS
jgi:hypothetical protein